MKLKETIKSILPKRVLAFFLKLLYPEKINILEKRLEGFFNTYYQTVVSPEISQKVVLRNAEFKVFSKHGCDGLLLYIFSKIGVYNHSFVEMGIQDGTECNTANLSINFGWRGLLIDANKDWVKAAQKYYKNMLGDSAQNVKVVDCFVTAENINSVLVDNKHVGEIDILSIDIDSNDYWVWKAISAVNPRVVVIEYNAAYGPARSMTIKYDQKFHYKNTAGKYPLYFGASLAALAKLGKQKGYTLVACDVHGHDAYFVRSDVAKDIFIEQTPANAFYPNPHTLEHVGDLETQFSHIKHLDFTEI